MSNKEIKEESKDRKIRRHEVSFSTIQGNQSQDYLDGYLNKHSSQESVDIVDQMVDKINKKILRESLSKLQGQDKLILCQYLAGTKQNVIAERFGISPSAINQALLNLITKLLNKQSPINLNSYSQGWKYDTLDENGIDTERDRILRELIDVR